MDSFTLSASESPVNVLEYLRSKSAIDYDSLDMRARGVNRLMVRKQWEAYTQLRDPANAFLVEESVVLARQLQLQMVELSVEELAVEIAMIKLALRVAPLVYGSLHVMCNPLYSWDTNDVYQTGHRGYSLCQAIEPSFDLSRLVMKVSSTWEGLQACSKLKRDGIKTLATTLFTMEQVVLAGEAGCTSISPFIHELRAHLDTDYHDPDPILDLVPRAQQYYKQHQVDTKVKSCAFMTIDEIISVAGVDAMTIPAEVLEELSSMTEMQEKLEARSSFFNADRDVKLERLSYIDDKVKFDRSYTTNGRGKAKTEDAIAVFCGFQTQAEALMARAGT
ncbi:hypothetical protein L249_3182 [Ophiocordyceps polyrhachis-furcata BCC 54312]|uniref:Transaldolase n=1 Tax=Ophiocordyceps polyrhachis-furcata BCC 54312 TaxID=1330021 RepID=A0A367LPC6_9HYPO|nr:hypothetical protein L249_3182 [Ophiocordyceps polyrhachis-furcata BCC 54312]